jgi:DNA (cytosine-5)-methyltransferase 1
MNHLSLFTGIGGADLASEWAGFTTVGQVEWADYPTKVLEKHWPNVPRWRDICEFGIETFRARTGLSTVDVISGGFPCQPFSVAGKRKGKDDDRFLWPEMLRVIRELNPTWIIGENVNGFVNMGLEDACIDLENQGYAVQAFIIPACAVQAWHERKRVFIVAYSDEFGRNNRGDNREERSVQSNRKWDSSESESERNKRFNRSGKICSIFQNTRCELFKGSEQQGTIPDEIGKKNANIIERPSEMVFNSNGERGKTVNNEARNTREGESEWESFSTNGTLGQLWQFEPNVGRVASRISARVDRLKCLGNAIVPQQIYPIFRAIAEIEGGAS